MNSIYKVFTLAGNFDAIFAEDEDIPIEYSGDELAINFFKDWLFINQVSGENGFLLDADSLQPNDLYGFCQPTSSGIIVIPPFDDLMSFAAEDIFDQSENDAMQTANDYEKLEEITIKDTITTDTSEDGAYLGVDSKAIAATKALLKYFQDFIKSDAKFAIVPDNLAKFHGTSSMDKEDAKRILRALIDVAINRKAGIPDMTPAQREKLSDFQHDARFISDYLTKRMRSTGSRGNLRTPELKAKYPHIDNQSRESFDSTDSATMDAAISGTEKLKLVKELRDIRAEIVSSTTGIEKLKMIKRINEIRKTLGVEVITNNDDQKEKIENTMADANKDMSLLKHFIGKSQLAVIGSEIRGEEGQLFKDKLIEVANTIQNMPKTYETNGQGDNAVARLHYFNGHGDWYITEKDMEDEQIQAFGLANLGYGGELGYINIQELINSGVELDLYWEHKTIGAIESGSDEAKPKVDPIINTFNPEEILDALVENYGWTEKKFQIKEDDGSIIVATVKKDVGGGITTGMVNREGSRNVYAKLDNSMHLTLMRGDSNEFSVDCYEKDPKDAAKEFDDLTTEWAVRTANDKKSLKVGAAQNDDNEQQVPKLADPIKDAFIAQLNTLKTETDINRFNERLDEIAARIEQAGMLDALDTELNQTADALTQLLSKAENGNN